MNVVIDQNRNWSVSKTAMETAMNLKYEQILANSKQMETIKYIIESWALSLKAQH